MLAPDRPQDHERALNAMDLDDTDAALTAAELWTRNPIELGPGLHTALRNGERAETATKALLRQHQMPSRAAAFVLSWILKRHSDGQRPRGAGVATAASAFADLWRREKRGGVTPKHVTDNVWPRYRSVAHLWAAFYSLPPDVNLLDPALFLAFLGTADRCLTAASQTVPREKASQQPVLTLADAWRIPDALAELSDSPKIRPP
jgi:hypothetical protein